MSLDKNLVVVLYDGIENSVFESQVLTPVCAYLNQKRYAQAYIFSFEKNPQLLAQQAHAFMQQNARLHIHLNKKTERFWGNYSIQKEWPPLQHYLQTFPSYDLIARGPIAGKLCQLALTDACQKLTIQIRGLLAEEYRYQSEQSPSKSLVKHLRRITVLTRYYQLLHFEKSTYQWKPPTGLAYTLEAVCSALKTYLITTYNVDSNYYTVATDDIPPIISLEQRMLWRLQIRKFLKLAPTTHVYVYNGSCKPWQCFSESVRFFKQEYGRNSDSFLLVITQDQSYAEAVLQKENINETYVITTRHADVIKYLCAADTGIILRNPHILNWTSRPTKALEYQAAGLTIMHNSTVAWLVENYPH